MEEINTYIYGKTRLCYSAHQLKYKMYMLRFVKGGHLELHVVVANWLSFVIYKCMYMYIFVLYIHQAL